MERSTGTLMCIGSAAGFGAMAVFGKLAYDEGTTVGTLLSARFALAAILFLGLLVAGGEAGTGLRGLTRRDLLMALGLGAFGYALQAGCFFAALDRIDASLLSLLLYTYPSMVAVAAILLRREHADGRRSPSSAEPAVRLTAAPLQTSAESSVGRIRPATPSLTRM